MTTLRSRRRRMNVVLALLLTSTYTSSALSPSSESPKRSRRISESSTSISQPTSSRLSSTAAAAQDGEGQAGRQSSRYVAPSAPLVDSALLRFVSAEKKKREAISTSLEKASLSSIYGGADEDDLGPPATAMPEETGDENAVASAELPSNSVEEPWMAQYNRNRIARVLESLGVEKELSMQAGDKVQEYILIRMTRRRVRAFLKERASRWSASYNNNENTENNNNNASTTAWNEVRIPSIEPVRLNYGFDDVLEVFQEYGFTGNDVCSILTHSPSLALMMPRPSFADESEALEGGTLCQSLDRAFRGTLMKTLGLRKYDARKVLRDCPGLLTAKGSKQAEQIVSMMAALGVSNSAIARDKAGLPSLLSRSPSDMFRLISFLSSGQIRMKPNAIGPLLRKRSSLELLDLVAPVTGSVQGKTRDEQRKMTDEVYRKMSETVRLIKDEIGTRDMGKVISAFPPVLLLDAEEQILPVTDFLMDYLEIDREEIASVMQLYPVLLSKNVDEMRWTVAYVLSLGVDRDDIGSIFRAFPSLLTTDVEESMEPVVDYLHSIGVTNIGAFVTKLPPVLTYSVEKDLKPKWNYFQRVSLKPSFELEEFPAYFSYPLDRRIKTRYDYLAFKGISKQLIPVAKVLRFGDVDFANTVARDDDGGEEFREFCERHWKGQAIPVRKQRPKPNARRTGFSKEELRRRKKKQLEKVQKQQQQQQEESSSQQ
ncbi:unnamed protein product [Cylindrotheca closterium]|uniref:mTERF domain-containing protein, mitochondrial n=1 Tax=Cylindrotheca closterium TaxID=2856 RepID=A0AAD2G853_9STRA|nr:unnamed protein product [Cylindrotheca closterium]